MDPETWIIDQLEPMAPDAPGEGLMDGPGGIAVRAEADWFEGEDQDSPCRGVDVEMSVAGEPVGAFAYAASGSGCRRSSIASSRSRPACAA